MLDVSGINTFTTAASTCPLVISTSVVDMSFPVITHPFTRADADIVLRSSDSVDFYVHRCILLLSSPTFETLLSIPQPTVSSPNDAETTKDGKPIIPMHGEDAEMLEAVLRECYPGMESNAQKDLRVMGKVLAMAEKFEMEGIAQKMGVALQQGESLQREPLRVYAIASRYRLYGAAEAAAKESLMHPAMPSDCPEEFGEISAAAHHKLLAYRERCKQSLDWILVNWRRELSRESANPSWSQCGGSSPQWRGSANANPGCPRLSDINYLLMPKLQQDMYKDCSLWFVDHVERVRAAFANNISGSTVASLQLLKRTFAAIRSANLTCPCGIAGPYHLVLFTEALAERIDRELDKIPFSIPKLFNEPVAIEEVAEGEFEAFGLVQPQAEEPVIMPAY